MTEPTKRQPADSVDTVVATILEPEVCKLVLSLWQRIRMDWSYATDRLSEAFRQHRELSSARRRAVAETLYGMIRHARRIDEALAAGGLKGVQRAFDHERLIAYLVLESDLSVDQARQQADGVDWAAVAEIDERIARDSKLTSRVARLHSLPDWLAEHLVSDWGDEALDIAAALNQRAPMTLRVNTLKSTAASLAEELAGEGLETVPGALCETALVCVSRTNLFSLPAFREGRFEAQDEGSQLIAEAVAPPPKALVVDFCAGAGGKTLALSALMNSRGRIVATDIFKNKLAELRRRARRAGASNVQAQLLAEDPKEAVPAAFDRAMGNAHRVLVDAPCSGIGALRRNPEARWRLTENDIRRLPQIQLDICRRAIPLVGDNGRLIYATCTVTSVENRGVVDVLLAENPELELVPLKEIWGRERAETVGDGDYLELLPNRHGTDGFFAAILRRRRGSGAR